MVQVWYDSIILRITLCEVICFYKVYSLGVFGPAIYLLMVTAISVTLVDS